MPEPTITLAMPFYNSAATLELSVRSLLHQSCGDFELLLCDDGSTDAGLAIARGFSDSRVMVSSDGKRLRLAARLNQCIDRARGRYLARMDADDFAYPGRLAHQLEFLENHPEIDLCSTGAMVFSSDGRPLWRFAPPGHHAAITRVPFRGFPLWHPAWMGRTAWFRRWRYDENAWLGQDQELLLRSYRDSRFANLPEVLLGYRREPARLSKLLRYKWLSIQYVCRQPGMARRPYAKLSLLAVTAARLAANCAAQLAGTDHPFAHQSAHTPSAEERAEWQHLWAAALEAPARP